MELPVTIPEEERDDKSTVDSEITYPEGITNVKAATVDDLIAKCRILITRHIKLHITDTRLGCQPAQFEGMTSQLLDNDTLEKEREWILQSCKSNTIRYEDKRITMDDDTASSATSTIGIRKTAGDIRKIMCEAAQAPAGDALDFAKAIGKEKDKCNAPALPAGNDKEHLDKWSWDLEDCVAECMQRQDNAPR